MMNPLSDLDVAVRFDEDVSEEERRRLLDTITAVIIESTGIDAVDLDDLERVSAALGYDILAHGSSSGRPGGRYRVGNQIHDEEI